MPNWCENVLVVEGPEADVRRFIAENTDPLSESADEKNLSFEMLAPTPPEKLEINTVGGDGWYEWRTTNWGTKWNASGVSDWEESAYAPRAGEISLRTEFDTAWAPPSGWLNIIAEHYPALRMQLDYVEHGVGFCGAVYVADGVATEEEGYYDPADYGYEDEEDEEEEPGED